MMVIPFGLALMMKRMVFHHGVQLMLTRMAISKALVNANQIARKVCVSY